MPDINIEKDLKKMQYTQDGYDALVDELNFLKNVKMPKIKEDIKTARGFGDLSENSEYDEARNEQTKAVYRIAELEELIENAEIIDESKIRHDVVNVGSDVKVYDYEFEEEVDYSIVGSNEANPLLGKISDQSPLGSAIVGRKEGDEVEFEAPAGVMKMKILKVSRTQKS